jgi:hypothetical protein
MLNVDDLLKIEQVIKDSFYTKNEMDVKFGSLGKNISNLTSSVDGYAKKADTYYQEMAAMRHR